MMRNEFRERVEQLLQQKEINENSELSHLFRLAIQNLDRNEKYQSVMDNLSQGLSLYLMTHHYQAPKSVITRHLSLSLILVYGLPKLLARKEGDWLSCRCLLKPYRAFVKTVEHQREDSGVFC